MPDIQIRILMGKNERLQTLSRPGHTKITSNKRYIIQGYELEPHP